MSTESSATEREKMEAMELQEGETEVFVDAPDDLQRRKTEAQRKKQERRQSWTANERQSMIFAKSTLAFKDTLDHVRERKSQPENQSYTRIPDETPPTPIEKIIEKRKRRPRSPKPKPSPKAKPSPNSPSEFKPQNRFAVPALSKLATKKAKKEKAHYDRRIRLLRTVQHFLTSILSFIIATLQGLTYASYMRTKGNPDAWPKKPLLFPTLILLSVAIMALAFDACYLIAYIWPNKRRAQRAVRLATNLHYWITAVKTLAYVVATTVCRAGYDMAGEKDLWGWSCSEKDKPESGAMNAKGNCSGSLVAWVLALLNIGVEVLGIVITWYINRRDESERKEKRDKKKEKKEKKKDKKEKEEKDVDMESAEEDSDARDDDDDDEAEDRLLGDSDDEEMDELADDVHESLEGLTPEIGDEGHGAEHGEA